MAKAKTPAKKRVTSSAKTQAKAKQTRIALSGKTTRAKGHLSAATRRSQAKRDSK